MQEERTPFGGSVVRNIPEPSTEPDQFAPHPVQNTFDACRQGPNGHDAWMNCSPDEPARVVQNGKLGKYFPPTAGPRQSKTGLFAAVPAADTKKAAAAKAAAKVLADFGKKYARASPSAALAVPFAPDGAVPRRVTALLVLRRPVERCAVLPSAPPPGGSRRARRSQRHVRCITRCVAYRAQEGYAEGSAAGAHPRAPHAAARTVALCARTRLCAVSLRWRARARSTRWVGFFRRRLRRDLQRRSRSRSIPRPGKKQSQACSRW